MLVFIQWYHHFDDFQQWNFELYFQTFFFLLLRFIVDIFFFYHFCLKIKPLRVANMCMCFNRRLIWSNEFRNTEYGKSTHIQREKERRRDFPPTFTTSVFNEFHIDPLEIKPSSNKPICSNQLKRFFLTQSNIHVDLYLKKPTWIGNGSDEMKGKVLNQTAEN